MEPFYNTIKRSKLIKETTLFFILGLSDIRCKYFKMNLIYKAEQIKLKRNTIMSKKLT